MGDIRVKKIKVGKGKKITVLIEKQRDDDPEAWDEYCVTSMDTPKETLHDAFRLLILDAVEILELPEKYGDTMKVTGVTFSHTNDIMGAVMTCSKELKTSNCPVIINTPHLPSQDYGDNEEAPVLSADQVVHLEMLADQAIDYAQGIRAQMEMKPITNPVSDEEVMRELAEKAKEVINDVGRASLSVLQRRLTINANKAMAVMEILEEDGFVGPPVKGKQTREILAEVVLT